MVPGGGHNFFDRTIRLFGQLGEVNLLVFGIGVVSIGLLVLGDRALPAKPVGLAIVLLSILIASV